MKRKLEISELIFKIIAYTLLTIFAICCLYPFVYALSASISGKEAVEFNEIILLPKRVIIEYCFKSIKLNIFW